MISNKKNILIVSLKDWNYKNFKKIKKQNFFLIKNKTSFNYQKIKKINPKYIFFPHWSYKISNRIIRNFFCIGFHATDLPYGRGGSPIQNLIIKNHKYTKITAFRVNESLDSGNIIMKNQLSLNGSAQAIYERASKKIFKIIKKIINSKKLMNLKQRGKIVYFKRLTNNSIINKNDLSIKKLYNKIRMLDAKTYPNAYFLFNNNIKINLYKAKVKNKKIYCEAKIEIKK